MPINMLHLLQVHKYWYICCYIACYKPVTNRR
nr:MAG TPA: hypothetical protein [Caudoviricetes sp.]